MDKQAILDECKKRCDTPLSEEVVSQVFSLNVRVSIMFQEFWFKGMVGESHQEVGAWLLLDQGWQKDELRTCRLTYSEVKEFYKYVEGRDNRISFHRWMKELSPAAREEEAERSLGEAISRVI